MRAANLSRVDDGRKHGVQYQWHWTKTTANHVGKTQQDTDVQWQYHSGKHGG